MFWEIRQRQGMARLRGGLERSGEKLANGKKIKSNADAVRWLLEQIEREEG